MDLCPWCQQFAVAVSVETLYGTECLCRSCFAKIDRRLVQGEAKALPLSLLDACRPLIEQDPSVISDAIVKDEIDQLDAMWRAT